jgi:hypothetical protein
LKISDRDPNGFAGKQKKRFTQAFGANCEPAAPEKPLGSEFQNTLLELAEDAGVFRSINS